MANIKSAKKRILVNQTRYERNKSVKSAIKTATKKVEAAVANKDKETAQAELIKAIKLIETAVQREYSTRTTLLEKFQD